MNSAANTAETIIINADVAGAIRLRTGRVFCTERFLVEATLAHFVNSYTGDMFSQDFYCALNTWAGRNAIHAEDSAMADYYCGSPALHACIYNQIAFWSYKQIRKAA